MNTFIPVRHDTPHANGAGLVPRNEMQPARLLLSDPREEIVGVARLLPGGAVEYVDLGELPGRPEPAPYPTAEHLADHRRRLAEWQQERDWRMETLAVIVPLALVRRLYWLREPERDVEYYDDPFGEALP